MHSLYRDRFKKKLDSQSIQNLFALFSSRQLFAITKFVREKYSRYSKLIFRKGFVDERCWTILEL